MKNMYLWIISIVSAFILGGLFFRKGSIALILPYGLILICPLMMFFMMGGHGDHRDK